MALVGKKGVAMRNVCKGNCIRISIDPNEFPDKRVPITLPDGYSYENIRILYLHNITELSPYFRINNNTAYHIPPVRSHSPSTFSLLLSDPTLDAEIRILIEKFGQIPDIHYFDKEFEPIFNPGR